MKLKVLSIHEKGDASKEYVLLEATEDCDVGNYAVADSTYTGEHSVSNMLRHVYWFPDKAIKKGNRVVLRTGAGTNGEYKTDSGKQVHRFFWGLKSSVWNDDGDAAVLLHIASWKITKT